MFESSNSSVEDFIKIKQSINSRFRQLSIKVDADSGNSQKEIDTFLTANMRVFNTVVMQDAIVDTFARSTLFYKSSPGRSISGWRGKKYWSVRRFGVDNSSIRGLRTIITNRATFLFTCDTRASPFKLVRSLQYPS